jgi:hypothetical protein
MHMRDTGLVLLVLFVGLCFVYYFIPFGAENTDKVFITITTFFFSIFTGFFISRQGARYTKLREIISTFDGKLSSVYRASQNVSPLVHARCGEIIKAHYQVMVDQKSWNYHFLNKSSTISSIHDLLEEQVGSSKQESLRNQAVGRMLTGLSDCQVLRKNMVMLFQERIAGFQWFLIIFFVLILLLAVSVIPSVFFLLGAVLKAAYVVAITSVVIILWNLDNLHLFEGFIGENSAKDVIEIIESKK